MAPTLDNLDDNIDHNKQNAFNNDNGNSPYENVHDGMDSVAIVGFSFEFPQSITSPESLWQAISQKKSAMTEFPTSRLNARAFYDPDTERLNSVRVLVIAFCLTSFKKSNS
jgi:hypothetical protein